MKTSEQVLSDWAISSGVPKIFVTVHEDADCTKEQVCSSVVSALSAFQQGNVTITVDPVEELLYEPI
jgi:hypothetical protein